MVGISKNDRTESGKRMFMNALTVQVSSEVPTPFMGRLYMRVNTVNIMYQPIGFTSTIPA
jgi:hypothetical protein